MLIFQSRMSEEYLLYDVRNEKSYGRDVFSFPLEGQIPEFGRMNAWPGSLSFEGFPLHEDAAYIKFDSVPIDQYIWGLRFIKQRLLEPVTITLQHSWLREEGYYKDNSK